MIVHYSIWYLVQLKDISSEFTRLMLLGVQTPPEKSVPLKISSVENPRVVVTTGCSAGYIFAVSRVVLKSLALACSEYILVTWPDL